MEGILGRRIMNNWHSQKRSKEYWSGTGTMISDMNEEEITGEIGCRIQ